MNTPTTTAASVTDPVCGMTIDPATAAGSSTYKGQTYHFCSRGCETKFNVAPTEYVTTAPAPTASASCCSTERSPGIGGAESCC
ncbi:MAG TPA: YHS domain-containing protein [Thermoanaerobaculia bacterium]|nr:YHS domain-containing protein [Thermoanaerobaculia bacterium]